MSSASLIDTDAILAPVSEDNPVGAPLNTSDPNGSFFLVKDDWNAAKDVERSNERNMALGEDLSSADWTSVIRGASDLLINESKDFRVASWLTDALLRQHGFAGLRAGLQVCRGLCERYWDAMHPVADEEDGHEARVSQFDGLTSEGGVLVLNRVAITKHGGDREFNGGLYAQAAELDGVSDPAERQSRIDRGTPTFDQFLAAVNETPVDFYRQLLEDMGSCIEDLGAISELMDERCAPDSYGDSTSPSVSTFRNALVELKETLEQHNRDRLAEPEEEGETGGELIHTGGPSEGAVQQKLIAKMSDAKPTSREDALGALQKIADFFAQTEPHSPISYKIRQTVHWANMSLPELIAELVNDRSVKEDIQRRTGLPDMEVEQ